MVAIILEHGNWERVHGLRLGAGGFGHIGHCRGAHVWAGCGAVALRMGMFHAPYAPHVQVSIARTDDSQTHVSGGVVPSSKMSHVMRKARVLSLPLRLPTCWYSCVLLGGSRGLSGGAIVAWVYNGTRGCTGMGAGYRLVCTDAAAGYRWCVLDSGPRSHTCAFRASGGGSMHPCP